MAFGNSSIHKVIDSQEGRRAKEVVQSIAVDERVVQRALEPIVKETLICPKRVITVQTP